MEMIDRLGVSPLPRNYHLFYICLSSTDQRLRGAVRALGNSPSQADLDDVIEKFVPEAMGSTYMRRHQDDVLRNLEGVLSKLNVDQLEAANFTGAVNKVSESLANQQDPNKIPPETLMKVAEAMVEAGRRKVVAGNKTISQVETHVDELGKLRNEIERLRLIANTDELTRLANRRSFDESLAMVYSNESRNSFGLVMLDIDHFKSINDTHGHAGGDEVLRVVAKCLRGSMRQDTVVARTGGEEFAIILKKTNIEEVRRAAERIREAVEKLGIITRHEGKSRKVTVSVGAAMADDAETPQALYELADAALYCSKETGRNRVTLSGELGTHSTERFLMYKKG
ncbi:GGDEF domain-containing protein [Rhizobium sp. BK176]|uniref:GGDEF domain-containing protein n=1 Tax=Rhizobium sp. BK176 TaxID=2587071 RepID=UPI002168CCF5|nr:GGDEF domain-containing protein [Rhizobium sp. BK176]MCS4089764.1 diguanylate cyclase [Rhizobium sp. BK176]